MDGWPPELQEAARFKEIPEASTIGQTHSKEDRRDVYFLEYGEGNGNSLQYSCLGNPMDRGVWWVTVHWISKELDTTQ